MPAVNDHFGQIVSIDGNIVAITEGVGEAVDLFDASTGDLVRRLANPSGGINLFGESLSVDSGKILVGADGLQAAAYLFDAATGNLLHTFTSPSNTFGLSVSLESNRALVGDWSPGFAYLFDTSTGLLLHTFSGQIGGFGTSVSIGGGKALIAGQGAAAVLFDTISGELLQTFFDPTPECCGYGAGVATDGNIVVIGDSSEAAYIFDALSGTLLHTLRSPNPAGSGLFGYSVSLDGDNVLVGAAEDSTAGTVAGAAFLFDVSSGTLLQSFLNPTPPVNATPDDTDLFGLSVSLSGENLVISAGGDDTAALNAGAAYLFRTTVSPDFQLTVSPPSRTVALTGSTTFTILIDAMDTGFDSPVSLSVDQSTCPNQASCAIDPNRNPVNPRQTSTLTVETSKNTPTGTYNIKILGTSTGPTGSLTRTQIANLIVTKLVGLKNVVTFFNYEVENSATCLLKPTLACFSIQQNFRVHVPGETGSYSFWAQNAIFVRRDLRGFDEAIAVFQVFSPEDLSNPVACRPGFTAPGFDRPFCFPGVGRWHRFELPVALVMTSQIIGNQLVMSNDVSGSPFTLPLGEGSFIDVEDLLQGPPELAIVGLRNEEHATFMDSTSGHVQSFTQLANGSFSESVLQSVLGDTASNCIRPCPQTSETSSNLRWRGDEASQNRVNFSFFEGAMDQGVRYRPES